MLISERSSIMLLSKEVAILDFGLDKNGNFSDVIHLQFRQYILCICTSTMKCLRIILPQFILLILPEKREIFSEEHL